MMIKPTRVLLAFILLFSACKVNQTTHVRLQDAYQAGSSFDRLRVTAWNVSPQISRLYFKVETKGLLYKKELYAVHYQARFKVQYQVYNLETPALVSDSMTRLYEDTASYAARTPLIDSFDIRQLLPGRNIVQVKLTDLNNGSESLVYLHLKNSEQRQQQDFLLRDRSGNVLFQSYLNNPAEPVFLEYRERNIPRLTVRYYKGEYPIALPPHVESKPRAFSLHADSVFYVDLIDGRSGPLFFKRSGLYFIQPDTLEREGLPVLSFYNGYPEVNTAARMLFPLRYISSKTEFGDMLLMKNSKGAVDDFWLDIAGNPDRAKEMIRKYYRRVESANAFFTSYHEGWKTDRGMIYIMYGPPAVVYKNPNGETWIYGEDRNVLSITFNFEKIDNPFSDNDYRLDRSVEYRETWEEIMQTWRN